MGRSHDPTVICTNETYNTSACERYCKARLIRDLELQREGRELLPSMLDYYWQNGISSKEVEFLEITSSINSYK